MSTSTIYLSIYLSSLSINLSFLAEIVGELSCAEEQLE